ncbi:MAG: hypothetical protein RBR48_03235 [Bacilli bacterium]|jgi:hypothetical protein|nr:hypothetical protein [Bacilli bacterium]
MSDYITPVMYIDPYGNISWENIGNVALAVGAVVLITAAVVCTAGGAAVILGASSTAISAVMTGAAIGGAVSGSINLGIQLASGNMEDIDYGSLALSTFIGSTAGAMSAGMGTLSSGTGSLLSIAIQKGMQAGANITIGIGLYYTQSIISGDEITMEGLAMASFCGLISGYTFNFDLAPSLAISLGVELAGYASDIYDYLTQP